MAEQHRTWKRQGEAFWRAHHEAWKRSDLNQRQYCEAQGLPQKGFENWRQKFIDDGSATPTRCGSWKKPRVTASQIAAASLASFLLRLR